MISPQLRDYIQLGILYSYTDYIGGLKTLTLTRDFHKNLNNSRVKFLKFNKKVLPICFKQEKKITNAIAWLKSNNNLTLSYPTIYECEEIKEALDKIDPRVQPSDDDYILIQPINADKEFRDQRIIEVLGREFVFTNKIPESILKQREQFSDLNNSYKSIVFYRDPYVEEKLFVHLFPKGVGGYNSTFYKYMPLNQYIKMRLLSGRQMLLEMIKDTFFFSMIGLGRRGYTSRTTALRSIDLKILIESLLEIYMTKMR